MSDPAGTLPTQGEGPKKRARPLSVWLAALFGAGFAPVAPGTFGTLASVPLAWALSGLPRWQFAAAAALVTAIAIPIAHAAGRFHGVPDHRSIVIDETAGYLVTLCGAPWSWPAAIVGFFVFRVLDIFKPWPASHFDRKVKNGAGVVLDDVCAGLYGAALLYGAHRLGWL